MQNKNKSYLDFLSDEWNHKMQLLGGVVLGLYVGSLFNSDLRHFNFAMLSSLYVITYAVVSVFGGAYYKMHYVVEDVQESENDLP